MKLIKVSLLAATALLSTITHAQTADDIINKHIEAIGGKDKIAQIKSVHMEGSMSLMGNDAPLSITIVNGKGYKSEVDFNGQKIVQTLTDTGGWMINPMMGSTDPQEIPKEQYNASKGQIYVGGELFDYASKGYKVQLAGRENVNNVNAYKLVLTSDNDSAGTTYYIDPNTYYMVKAVKKISANGQEAEVTSTFSDFRKTDYGYVVPFSIETTLPQGFSFTSSLTKVDVNKDVDPNIFAMPK